LDISRAVPKRRETIKIDNKTTLIAEPPPGPNMVLPTSPEFIANYIKGFFPPEKRKGIKTVRIRGYIPDSECLYMRCAGEYVPPDEVYIYYVKLNEDGTYGPMRLTREEYLNKLMYDVLPHEFGHKIDCTAYTKRTGKTCVPSPRAERAARAKASGFRKELDLPERWYNLTNQNPSGYYSNTHYIRDTYGDK